MNKFEIVFLSILIVVLYILLFKRAQKIYFFRIENKPLLIIKLIFFSPILIIKNIFYLLADLVLYILSGFNFIAKKFFKLPKNYFNETRKCFVKEILFQREQVKNKYIVLNNLTAFAPEIDFYSLEGVEIFAFYLLIRSSLESETFTEELEIEELKKFILCIQNGKTVEDWITENSEEIKKCFTL